MLEFKKEVGFVVGLDTEKKVFRKEGILVEAGYGEKNSILAANKLIDKGVKYLISFGLAGSISNKLKCGDIIIPRKIIWSNNTEHDVSAKLQKYLKKKLNYEKIFNHKLVCSKKILFSEEEKKKTFLKYKADAVDMESEWIQKEAMTNKICFITLRVIFDDLHINVPQFIENCLDHNGKIITKNLFLKTIFKPKRILSLILFGITFFKIKIKLKRIIKSILK